jgi:hypothetical protein
MKEAWSVWHETAMRFEKAEIEFRDGKLQVDDSR